MKYNYCGHSGLQLPAISLGLWHNFGEDDPMSRCRDIVMHAFDQGITHFDLANNYGPPPGSAEQTFGRILSSDLRSHRDEIIVTSKAGHLMWPGPYGDGGSRKYIMASIDQSLRRTGLEYFDIFYSHRHTPDTPLEETVQALIDIVKQGKALYIGLSKYPVEVAEQACAMMREQHVRALVYQDRYNMLCRKPEAAHLDMLRRLRLGFVAFSPLAQGLLTSRYLEGIPAGSRVTRRGGFLHADDLRPELIDTLRNLDVLARSLGMTLAQMSLAWVLAHQEVTSVIVGASSTAQLDDSLHAVSLSSSLTPEVLGRIDDILTTAIQS